MNAGTLLNSQVFTYTTFGGYVRAARKIAEITQDELATCTGLSRQTIVDIEGDRTVPNLHNAVKILRELRDRGSPDMNIFSIDV